MADVDAAVAAVRRLSRSLDQAIDADPGLVAGLELDPTPDVEALSAATDLGELRRWKRRELIRVAGLDLTGEAQLVDVGHALADIADECLRAAVRLAGGGPDLAVIGMGKLGGQELNYASDVDVVFVHRGSEVAAAATARSVIRAMTERTAEGIVFRTDADLRPEGSAGPLSRTPAAFAEYFARWAKPWERQAYIKTRFVAGSREVANDFFDAVRPYVWEHELEPGSLTYIRELKQRVESLHDADELKRGPGGIRDVEFAVQMLQLVHGRRDASVRSPNTIEALLQLARAGYVDAREATHLSAAYGFLRTVEHRLQLRDERQVHEIPDNPRDREWLAGAMGYRRSDEFETSLRRYQGSVREIHERLFYRPLLDWIAEAGDVPVEGLQDRLTALGFAEPERAAETIERLTTGLSRPARVLNQIFPLVLESLAATPNPDLGLIRLAWVTDGQFRANSIVPVLRESPESVSRLCRLLGSSAFVVHALRRHPEFVRKLTDDIGPRPLAALEAEARSSDLRRFCRREVLRIAARNLLGLAGVVDVGRELTDVARAALATVTPDQGFAVIGMGRFGAAELSYSSDLDVMFVHDGDPQQADKTARAILAEIGATTAEGRVWEIDARLRPDGESGPLSRSLEGFRRYYAERAQLWEFQAMLRAGIVAGDAALGAELLSLAAPYVYSPEFGPEQVEEVREMKRKVERERRGGALKLGPGGLADIEFTVQLLQLEHGHVTPEIRTPSTAAALPALVRAGLLDEADGARLDATYRFISQARNMNFLLTNQAGDELPDEPEVLASLNRLMGCDDMVAEQARLTGEARDVAKRVFYGVSP